MRAVFIIFQRAIVWDYYRKNVLFLLVIVLFAFGFLSGQEHQTIVKQALNSPKLLVYTGFLWLLHGVKTYLFILRSLGQPEFRFLFHLRLLNLWQRLVLWGYVSFMLSQLTFLYAIFMVVIGFILGKLMSVVFILSSQLFVMFLGVFIYERRIRQTPEAKAIFSFSFPQFFKFRLPAVLFYHKYLLYKEPILLLLTKFFSIFSVLFMVWLFPTDEYDHRLFSIAAVIIAVSHLRICSQYVYFHNSHLAVFNNLPLGFWYKSIMLVIGYFILLLPEIYLFMVRAQPLVSLSYAFAWLIFVISLVVFIHGFQYLQTLSDDSKMQYFFFGFVFVLLLVMYKVPLFLLSSFFFLCGFGLLKKLENDYEPVQ
ncbi:hypothetical protein [Lacihabitans soyangensis]|uniref:Uncharacterized protein n=1 Tax=Lacihabitans soyangensis TaxID=869394 RepID=A0AAE3KTH1_9BACT|nr:hypothetical protein [Lacihabitans soyangensis]MCP9764407.1 hypothetical protein [Lacihabitans soyangensis]